MTYHLQQRKNSYGGERASIVLGDGVSIVSGLPETREDSNAVEKGVQ